MNTIMQRRPRVLLKKESQGGDYSGVQEKEGKQRLKPKRQSLIQMSLCILTGYLLGFVTNLKRSESSVVGISLANSNSGKNLDHNNEGWNDIHVYVNDGKFLGGKNDKSQCGQDRIVSQLHQQLLVATLPSSASSQSGGFFVDLASNDATHFSNTYHILEKEMGWKGLCIEPNPTYWSRLVQRKGCTVVAAALGENVGEEVQFVMHYKLRQAGGGLVDGDRFDNKASRPKTDIKPTPMFTTTLSDVLGRFQAPPTIDYLSLDVEGAEYFVMQYFPFKQYTIHFLTVERPKQELIDLLYDHGYQYLGSNNEWGMETLWVNESIVAAFAKKSDFDAKVQSILTKEGWNFMETTKYLKVPEDRLGSGNDGVRPQVIWKD